jgi:hypothetical protein
VFAGLVAFLFLFNIMGYYFVFDFNRHVVRDEMKQLIKAGYFEDSFIVLKIENPYFNPDFKKVNNGEFRYKDKLYDIVSETKTGNCIIFKCINDKKEEKLLAGFHRVLELALCQNNPSKAKHATALLYHIIKLALPEGSGCMPLFVPADISFFTPIHPAFSIFHPPYSPPPELS